MPKLCRITLFPIKSLDGVDVPCTRLLPSGPLKDDRRFAILDREGRLIHGKRTAAVHRIRARFDPDVSRVGLSLSTEGSPSAASFSLASDCGAIASWLGDALGTTCRVEENTETAFPDDAISPGPTIISTESLREVSRWFRLPIEEIRRRFRANLEVDAEEPFWEDRLFGPSPQRPARFTIGRVRFYGMNPCARCVVPTRDPETGRPTAGFAKRLTQLREEALPEWAQRDAFDHFFRLAVNTTLAPGQEAPLEIQVGDEVQVL